MKSAHLTIYQAPRNPTPAERQILTLIAEGHTRKQAAAHLRITHRSLLHKIESMRNRYTAPTTEALIAIAVRLQWITLAIDCLQDA